MEEQKPKEEMKTNQMNLVDNFLNAISYVWVLVFLAYFMRRDNPNCQFHIKQGLVLFVFSLVVMVLGMIPFFGWLFILSIGWILIVILSILGILNALSGKEWEMPFLGKYAKQIRL